VVVVSDSANASEAPTGVNSSPRALIHKKILETAASMPEATMAAVAEEVSGASTDLVERVLDEYGDPAASADSDPDASEEQSSVPSDAPATPDGRGAETASDETPVTDPDELTKKERAVLEVVAERPDATQQAVADVLGVSRATVSKRASGIEGFDWSDRASFVERLFGTPAESRPLVRGDTDAPTVSCSNLPSTARADGDGQRAGDALSPPDAGRPSAGGQRTADREDVLARLDRIEARLDALAFDESAGAPGGITDPELAHKVVHACMESEHVSEDEELDVVAAVLQGDAPA
jgi:DNA-binding NarL/FixJ family response regulator